MSEEFEKNPKETAMELFKTKLENYDLADEEKELVLNCFAKVMSDLDENPDAADLPKAVDYILDRVIFSLNHAKASVKLINEFDNLDNKKTLLKNFKRKLLKGDTAGECLDAIKSWFELCNYKNFPNKFTEHLNELLGLDVESIVSLANRHRMDFSGGKNKFRAELREFKEQDCNVDTKYFHLVSFLIELASKIKQWPTPMAVQVETAHHYFNAKELIRLAEEDFAKEETSAKIAKYFFELGALYQGVMFAGHFSDERVLKPLTDRMRSEICTSSQKKEASTKFDMHLGYALDAWNAGCKLLHKQMGILLWVGVDNKSSSLKLLYEDVKRVAEPEFVQGRHDVEVLKRTVKACPCPDGEQANCPMIKILPRGSYFNVQGTHSSEVVLLKRKLEFDSYKDAKRNSIVYEESQD